MTVCGDKPTASLSGRVCRGMVEAGGEGAASTEAPKAPLKACLAKSGLTNGKLDSPSPAAQPHPSQPQPAIRCPQCGNTGEKAKIYKCGMRYLTDGSAVQRFLCMACGYRFSLSNMSEHASKIERQNLKAHNCLTFNRQACDEAHGRRALATRKGLAVLAVVESPAEGKPHAGGDSDRADGQHKQNLGIRLVAEKEGPKRGNH
ncbi:MAG: hypothetical protein QXO67_00730 [Candidatus Bathyarchaeia archaeon]